MFAEELYNQITSISLREERLIVELIGLVYLLGVVFNILIFVINLVKDFKNIKVNYRGTLIFIILSWLIYPILYFTTR
ncbi:hypothetical protein JCM15060_16460 [Halanaerobaculum tunisiense]